MYYVYGIIDPTENMIGYVGITSNTPQQRLVQHMRQDERDRGSSKRRWLNNLLENGFMPTVVTLQMADTVREAQIAERWWIAHGQMIGWPLRNSSNFVRQSLRASDVDDSDTEDSFLYAVSCDNSEDDTNDVIGIFPEYKAGYPLGKTRELTEEEASWARHMKAEGVSGNVICERIFGPKNTQRLEIIRRAIEGGAA